MQSETGQELSNRRGAHTISLLDRMMWKVRWIWCEYRTNPYSLRQLLSKKGRWKHHLYLLGKMEPDTLRSMGEMNIRLVKPENETFAAYSLILAYGIYTKYEEFLPEGLVLDVGAQYGEYAILSAKKYGATVHAFEPLTKNFRVMSENVRLNGLEERITLHNAAVGNTDGNARISFTGNMARVGGEATCEVRIMAIDSMGLSPSLLKIDVEGMEIKVLTGAKRTIIRSHPKVIIETHSRSLRKQVDRFMREAGYTCVHSDWGGFDEDEMDELMNRFYLPRSYIRAHLTCSHLGSGAKLS